MAPASELPAGAGEGRKGRMMHDKYCTVADCLRIAERSGLCSTHRKRAQRGQQLGLPVAERFLSTWDRLHAAALDLADADTEDDAAYRRAEDRLRKAIDARVEELLAQRNPSPPRRRMAGG